MSKEYNVFDLLTIYYDEWKFRQENFWKRIIQFFVIIFFISTFPITFDYFYHGPLPDSIDMVVFPIVGIGANIFFFIFCLSESYRINSIDDKIKRIISDTYSCYSKNRLLPLNKEKAAAGKEAPWVFRMRMAIWVPVFLTTIQVLLACFIIMIVTGGGLS